MLFTVIVTVKLNTWKVNVIGMVSPPFGKCGQPPAVVVQRLAAEAALPVYHDSTGFARGCLLSAGRDLTVAAGADIIKIEKGAATSGWLFSRIRNQAKARNRHLAEWRFLRFLMMIVTVKLPMCIVIRMVSPPLGKCGQPPAVVVQRLAAGGGVISIASFDTLRKVVALRGAFL